MKCILNDRKRSAFGLGMVLASWLVAGIFMQSCSNWGILSDIPPVDPNFAVFEKEFAGSLSSDKHVVRLIGFKTIPVAEKEREAFKKIFSEHGDEMKKMNNIVATDYSCYRIYFPLHTAIVEYKGKTYTADEKGVVYIPGLKDVGKIVVIGRKRSETVRGTGSNIIEKDRIRLKNPLRQKTQDGIRLGYSIGNNACIFNMDAMINMGLDLQKQ